MARTKTYQPLSVFLNGRMVGQLERRATGAVHFTYDRTWLDWEHAMSVSRSLPLREDSHVGEPVFAYFDNLLPESEIIRSRLAARMGVRGSDMYSLLGSIGGDCVGALQFLPQGETPGDIDVIHAESLAENDVAVLLRNLKQAPLGLQRDEEFRISLAGVQDKTALLFHEGTWCKPGGATPTTHILKPPIGMLANGLDLSQSVENEFLCMKLTRELGLATAGVAMADFEDQHALVVERFDRIWTQDGRLLRRPQEDCCQALGVPPAGKYESDGGPGMVAVLNLLKESDRPREDQAFFLRAQVVFWLMGATDGHGKNFSLFLAPGEGFRMTPLYDVLSVLPNTRAGELSKNRMKLAMAVGGNRHYVLSTILPRHFLQTAKQAGIGGGLVDGVFHELCTAIPGAVNRVAHALPPGFPEAVSGPVFQGLEDSVTRLG